MVQSKYLTSKIPWSDRIHAMREDLQNGDYNYLYFKIALSLIDAKDNADYDREKILRQLVAAFRKNNVSSMIRNLDKLALVK